MSSKSLPSLHLLKALLATARHGSMSRAAEELHLTPGAVSKQVQELESLLGVPLFERVRKQLHLTPVGERYVSQVGPLVTQLEEATLAILQSAGETGSLGLSTVPAFGAKCLFPHMAEFRRLYPQVELRYVPYVRGYEFASDDLDCAIRWGTGAWPGTRADYLAGHARVVIAPPARLDAQPLDKPQDVAAHTLLHHVSGGDAWAQWCARHGVSAAATVGPRLDMVSSIVQAVAGGMGIALLPRCVVEEEIATGAVRCPFPTTRIEGAAYYLCYPEAKASLPALQAFRGWLLGRMQALGA